VSLSFIIPLTTVVVAVYFFKRSSDEIAYLAAIIAVVGLLLTLVLAPWQIQLLLLVVAAVYTKILWQTPPSVETTEEPEAENKTTLLYRGSNYEHETSNVEVAEVEVERKYRGQVWKTNNFEEAKAIPQTFQITYRGGRVNCQKYVTPPVEEIERSERDLTQPNESNPES